MTDNDRKVMKWFEERVKHNSFASASIIEVFFTRKESVIGAEVYFIDPVDGGNTYCTHVIDIRRGHSDLHAIHEINAEALRRLEFAGMENP